MKVLVTGAAGFIGMHTALKLLERGEEVVGVDNLNDYYDVQLKQARLDQIKSYKSFRFLRQDIADRSEMGSIFATQKFDKVIHLAAQAGVRYSILNPHAYVDSNLVGFVNILEGCRNNGVQHLVYASSSSVYGGNKKMPFSEHDGVDHPVSLYAATKKANELMAHTYSHLYRLPTTGLRFFTVYGPWGRPDMAPMLFANAIYNKNPIKVFNYGNMQRDFTYIDDIVEGVVRVLDRNATPDSVDGSPYRIFNIGNQEPVQLLSFISEVERAIGVQAKKTMLPIQDGDVVATFASTELLQEWVDFKPSTPISAGVDKFIEWYKNYYEI